MCFGRPKGGIRLGMHSQNKRTWIPMPLFLQQEDPDALRAQIAFFLTFFSLYTLPLGDVLSSRIACYTILLFLTVGHAFFSILVHV